MHFPAHFRHEISQSGQICDPYFLEQFTLLAAPSRDDVHGNCHCNSICVCLYSFVSLFLPFSFSLISNLHLTPSWGKAPHSSTVFVPVTSKAPPAYQYQLRQCWACNLQLNVILLNPIWKLNIEKPLAYLPVFLPPSPSSLLAAIPLALSCRSHRRRACALVFRNHYFLGLTFEICRPQLKRHQLTGVSAMVRGPTKLVILMNWCQISPKQPYVHLH